MLFVCNSLYIWHELPAAWSFALRLSRRRIAVREPDVLVSIL